MNSTNKQTKYNIKRFNFNFNKRLLTFYCFILALLDNSSSAVDESFC